MGFEQLVFDASRAFSVQGVYATSELLIAAPAGVLAILPVWHRLRVSKRELVIELALCLAVLVIAGPVLAGFQLSSNVVLFPVCVVYFLLYCRAFDLPLAQKAFTFLSMAALGAFITYAALIVDTYTGGIYSDFNYLAAGGAVAQWALWALSLASLVRPLHNTLLGLLESKAAGPLFWRIAWLLPAGAIVSVVALVPEDLTTLFYRRVGPALIMIMLIYFALLVVAYALMFRLVRKSEAALAAAEGERQAQTQLLMEERLDDRMEAARRARHDQRQHDRAVMGFLDEGDLDGLRSYLGERDVVRGETAPLRICENVAVNAVAAYYWECAIEGGASEVTMELDVPRHIAQRERDVTVVLGNLLENAVDAIAAEGTGTLDARVRTAEDGSLFIAVDNSCTGSQELSDALASGRVPSTKHAGLGLGIQSVRDTAESTGGTARFTCDDGFFRASVMLGA